MVRIQTAIDASQEGRQAHQELLRLYRQLQQDLNRRSKELRNQREALDNASTANRASLQSQLVHNEKKLYQDFLAAKQLLEQKEQARLEQLRTKIDRLVDQVSNQEGHGMVVSDQVHRFTTIQPACDRTDWFVAKLDNKQPSFVQDQVCCVSLFATIDIQTLLNQSQRGQKALIQLERLYRSKQQELDRRRERVQQIRRTGKMAQAHQNLEQLDAQFKAYSKELAAEQHKQHDQLLARLAKLLDQSITPSSNILFLSAEKERQNKHQFTPSCDVTQWATTLFDTGKAPQSLAQFCAGLDP